MGSILSSQCQELITPAATETASNNLQNQNFYCFSCKTVWDCFNLKTSSPENPHCSKTNKPLVWIVYALCPYMLLMSITKCCDFISFTIEILCTHHSLSIPDEAIINGCEDFYLCKLHWHSAGILFCFLYFILIFFLSKDWQSFPQFPFSLMSSEQQEKSRGTEDRHIHGTMISVQILRELELPIYQYEQCFNLLLCQRRFPVVSLYQRNYCRGTSGSRCYVQNKLVGF